MFSSNPISTIEIAGRLAMGIKMADVSVVKDCLNQTIPDADRPLILNCFYNAVQQYAKANRDTSSRLLQIITEFLNKKYNPYELIAAQQTSIASFAETHCSGLIPLFTEHLKRANQQLVTAVSNSDCTAIKSWVLAGAAIDGDQDNEPVIHIAAGNPSSTALKTLLELGASPTKTNKNTYRPLHTATKCDRLKNMTALLDCGVDVNQTTHRGGLTALHIAANHGNAYATALLLNRGANPFMSGETKIDGALKIITPLDACYINKNACQQSLTTAITIVRGLAAIANQENFNAIFDNIKIQPTGIILLSYFVFHLQTHYQLIPLSLLSLLRAELRILPNALAKEIKAYLQTLQAQSTLPQSSIIGNALSRRKQDRIKQEKLSASITEGNEKEIHYLLDDESVCIEDRSSLSHHRTPLILASSSEKSSANIVALLLSRGAYVNASVIVDGQACSALSAAAECGHIDRMKLLVTAGASINSPERTTSAMHRAARAGQTDVIDFLLSLHADVITSDEQGLMPIQVCPLETNNHNRCAITIIHHMALVADRKNINEIMQRIFYLPKSAYEMMMVFLISLEKRPSEEKRLLSEYVQKFFSRCFTMWSLAMDEYLFAKLKACIPNKLDQLSILDNCAIINVVMDEGKFAYLLKKRNKYLASQQPKANHADKSSANETVYVDALLLESGTWHKIPACEIEPADPVMTAFLLRHFGARDNTTPTPHPVALSAPTAAPSAPPAVPSAPPASHPTSMIYSPFLAYSHFRATPAPAAPPTAESSSQTSDTYITPPTKQGFHL